MYAYVFVLWADQFDETVATIFITELREAGLRVKLIGLTAHQVRGAYGLALVPDLTLDQALPLTFYVICLIIPCTVRGSNLFNNDPRLKDFFERVLSKQAQLVIGSPPAARGLGLAIDKALIYPGREDLIVFARRLAETLLGLGPPLL